MYLSRMQSALPALSKTEKKIAAYIESSQEAVGLMTSYKLADHLGVSQASIIRFSRKLGYSNYREMQIDLTNMPKEPGVEDVKVDETFAATNYKIMNQYQEAISLTFAQNSENTIEQVIDYIKSSKKIVMFGMGSSHLFANYFSLQLMKLGIFSESPSDAHITYTTLSFLSPEDLLIIVSQSGKTKEVLEAAKIAYRKKIPIISITDSSQNKLYNLSDIVLKCSTVSGQSRLQTMTSRCSLLCLIDMVYLNLFKTDYKRYEKMLQNSEAIIYEKNNA